MNHPIHPSRQIPITVITGFLGAGKTTLLGRLLKHPALRRSAVIINEFGEVPLDHELVEAAAEDIVEVSGGCLCCTVRGDLSRAIRSLDLRRRRDRVMPFERLLIETTGLADPAPILHTLITDPIIAHGYRLDGVVTVVDAINGAATLDLQPEAVRQVAIADRVLMTKMDLARGVIPERLRARLQAINPMAGLLRAQFGVIDPDQLFDLGPWRSRESRADIDRWLGDGAPPAQHHEHHAHGHDPNRHNDRIRAFCLRRPGLVAASGLALFLELLTAQLGPDLLRLKGIVGLTEDPERPLVLHAVQHLMHEPIVLEGWPSADHDTRLVFIVRDLPEAGVVKLFDGLMQAHA